MYGRFKATVSSSPASTIMRVGIGVSISALAIFLIAHEVNLGAARAALTRVSSGYLVLALASVIINTLAKTQRWRVLLGQAGRDAPFTRLLVALLTGQMLNALLPIRLGDLSRSVDIGARGAGGSFVLGTVVIEKMIDLLCLAIVCLCVILLFPLPGWLGQSVIPTTAAAMLSLAIVVALVARLDWVARTLTALVRRLPERWHGILDRRLQSALDSLRVLKNTPDRVRILFWSGVVWASALANNYLVLLAFDIQAPLVAAGLLLVLLLVGVSISALPGGVGLFEYLCIVGLGLFTVDRAVALTCGVVLHAITLLPMILIGPVYLVSMRSSTTLSGLLRTIRRT